jgi:hypothetical protein
MSDSEEYTITVNGANNVNKQKKFIRILRDKKIIKTNKTEEEKNQEQKEKLKKRQQRENILKSRRDREEFLELDGKKFIYQNQKDAANKVLEAYKNGAIAVCLIAQPGTGKTGTAQEVMINMATNPNDDEIIYAENIINCTGMSDNDWEQQFKDSVLPAFRDQIYHRQNLIRQTDKLRTLKNGLIIPDECHIASGSKMTIAKTLKEAGLLDINVLEIRNIKMLDISATPDAVLHDYAKWGNKCSIIKIQPGPSYKGFEVMLEENRIINAPNFEEIDDYLDLLDLLEERYKNTTKKYFIFRLLDQDKIIILENLCDELDWNYLNHNSDERIDEIDTVLKNHPVKHTIIFIKGFWRASKRISNMNHIGATYEPIPKIRNSSGAAQSNPGRFCDNYEYSGDQLDINLRPLHFCDKGAIEQYVEWFNNDCDFSISEYKSNRISSNGKGKVSSKPTKVSPKIVNGINDLESVNQGEVKVDENKYRVYDNEIVVKNVCKILGYDYRATKNNSEGFKETSLNRKKEVASLIKAIAKIPTAYANHGEVITWRTYFPCYVDITNIETLRFVVIIRPETDINKVKNEIDTIYPQVPY